MRTVQLVDDDAVFHASDHARIMVMD